MGDVNEELFDFVLVDWSGTIRYSVFMLIIYFYYELNELKV